MSVRNRDRNSFRLFAVAALLCFAAGSAAHAEWLVTAEGDVIETRGPWRVEGSRVVFHSASGTLTTMRLSAIDLEASEAYAEKLAAPVRPEPPAAPAEPVLVLTQSDLPRARTAELEVTDDEAELADDPSADDDGEAGGLAAPAELATPGVPVEEPAPAEPPPPKRRAPGAPLEVVVTSWQEQSEESGLRFIGTLANDSKDFATQVQVEAAIYDEAGRLLDTRPARLARSSISPGRSTTFEVEFPQVFTYGEVRFTPRGRGLAGSSDATGATADEPTPR